MPDRNELLQFEKQLLTIANEDRIYTENHPFQSILDAKRHLQKQNSVLSSILDTALEQQEQQESEHSTSSQVIDAIDSTDISDVSQEQVPIQEEKKENQNYEFTEFVLPSKYKSITVSDDDTTQEGVIDAQDMGSLSLLEDEGTEGDLTDETDIELSDLEDIHNFSIEQYEDQLAQSSVEIKDEQILQFIKEEFTGNQVQETIIESEEEDGIVVQFEEEEEAEFFNNLKLYTIFLQRAIIETINTKDDKIVVSLIAAVINKLSSSYIRRVCEGALGYSVPLFEDSHVYKFDELSVQLSSLSDTVLRATRNFFLRIFPKVAVAVALLFGSYLWIVQPLRAWLLYREGYSHLQAQEYEQSETLFLKASSIRYMASYYFRYAEEYIQQQLYLDAEKKYEQLLFGLNDSLRKYIKQRVAQNDYFKRIIIDNKEYVLAKSVNYNREGFLHLISFVRNYQGNNELAIHLYNMWLFNHKDDTEFILGKADTYIDMYDMFLDDTYLHYAKYEYNKVADITHYAVRQQIPMLRWAVRDKSYHAQQFIEDMVMIRKILTNESFQSHFFLAYTDTIEYLLQYDYYDYVPPILETLLSSFSEDPFLHVLQAKYLFRNKEYALAQEQFMRSEVLYEQKSTLTLKDIYRIIESKVVQAEMALENNNQIVLAEQFLNEAQHMYEAQASNSFITRKNDIARFYFYKAKLLFYRNELENAGHYVRKSLQEQYNTAQVHYLYALIQYVQKNWNKASSMFLDLLSFYPEENESRKRLLVSTANSLFKKENYEAAIVHYTEAIQLQKRIFKSEEAVSLIDKKLDIFFVEAVSTLAYLKNNIGVAFFELYQRDYSNKEYLTRALQELRESHTMLQNIYRQDTIRSAYTDLPYTNLSIVLGNVTDIDMKIFEAVATELPDDGNNEQVVALLQ